MTPDFSIHFTHFQLRTMKKSLIYLLILSIITLPFVGCLDGSGEEASGTVPWGAPTEWEGAGPGLPNMSNQN